MSKASAVFLAVWVITMLTIGAVHLNAHERSMLYAGVALAAAVAGLIGAWVAP